MCFYRYIKPWAATSLGRSVNEIHAILAEDVSFSAPLTYFLQVRAVNEKGKLIAYPQAGGGSGDFANLKNVTGFLQLDLERAKFNAGEVFPYIAFR
jgi:molybdopterin molybdotransferase